MSTFRTRSEIIAASEIIQYLEQVKSGSLAGSSGINRALERLAENLNAVLEAVQSAKMSFVDGGGTVTFAANVLSWTTNIDIHFPGELGAVKYNRIAAASSPVVGLTGGQVVYVKLDRATDGAVLTVSVAATMAAFLGIITAASDRLDYLIIARASTGGITFFTGHRLTEGYSFTDDWYRDTQYGQQTELTTVHENEKENLKFILTGGGNLTWDLTTTTFAWSANLFLEFPSSVGLNRVNTGSAIIPAGSAFYVTLTRTPGGVVVVSPTIAAIGSVPNTDNVFVVALHKAADSRLYLWNGQSLGDGDSALLGGLRAGLQWFYKAVGPGPVLQTTDFTQGGAFPSREYRVGTHELLVFRNGVKQKASSAFWTGGVYPTGSLVGATSTDDHYVEASVGDGTGTSIIWLQDGQVAAEPLYHPAATHDPVWTWPGAQDYIEGFVGVHGEGPSPVEDVGIYPEPGGGPLEGSVKIKAGAGVSAAYDIPNNAIVISVSTSSLSLELLGGVSGLQVGLLKLVEPGGTLVEISDATPLQFSFDIKSPYKAALTEADSPSATNPYTAHNDFDFISGFDVAWTVDGTPKRVMIAGGILRSGGKTYRSLRASGVNGRVTILESDVFGAPLTYPSWAYLYLYPAVVDGEKPRGALSSVPPDFTSDDPGTHPTDATYKFLTSVRIGGSNLAQFRKVGSWVRLLDGVDLSGVFAITFFDGNFHEYNFSGSYLPSTWPVLLHIRITCDGSGMAVGERARIRVRDVGFSNYTTYYSIRPQNTGDLVFDLWVPMNPDQHAEINFDTALSAVNSAELLGYSEGRLSTSEDMGA